MKKNRIYIIKKIILIILTLFLFNCKKSTKRKSFSPVNQIQKNIIFSGKIISNDNSPIEKALININNNKTSTDKSGYFKLKIKNDGKYPDKNKFIMNVNKKGYGLLSRIYKKGIQDGLWRMTKGVVETVDPFQDIIIQNIRVPFSCTGTLSSKVNWSAYLEQQTVKYYNTTGQQLNIEVPEYIHDAISFAENCKECNPGISINISANSLIDNNGNPPQGKVDLIMSTIDIYDTDSMPGDYTARINNQLGYMQTFGAGFIEIVSKDKKYQLKKGSKAILTIPINPLQSKYNRKLRDKIPLLHYKENEGIWEVIGNALLNKKRDAYIAELTHFSAFNMDLVKTDQSCVKINSERINGDYQLEVIIPFNDDVIVRSYQVDNTPEKLHTIYNLPSNTNIILRAYEPNIENELIIPITNTKVLNTGAPQDPSNPNCPDYPYSACKSLVNLVEYLDAPILYGPTQSSGNITLGWEYYFQGSGPLASTNDGYTLEESTTGSTSGFNSIYHTPNDHRENVVYNINRTSGTYWYRVKAFDYDHFTPYSNVVEVNVDTSITNSPTTLRIINNLYDQVAGENDWSKYNNIIRVRIGPTQDSVLYSHAYERLYPGDGPIPLTETIKIPPIHNSDTSYLDFDVSGFGPDGYWVYIQTGWWEELYDYYTLEFLGYTKHVALVANCDGATTYKWTTIRVYSPFGNPEIIRARDFLPDGNWIGSEFCQ